MARPTKEMREVILERRVRAFEMRKAGASQHAIARALGVSRSVVVQDLDITIKDVASKLETQAKTALVLELTRLDTLQRALWPLIVGVDKPNVEAVHAVLAIMKHRADLLGLNAPDKLDLRLGNGPPTLLWEGGVDPSRDFPDVQPQLPAPDAIDTEVVPVEPAVPSEETVPLDAAEGE